MYTYVVSAMSENVYHIYQTVANVLTHISETLSKYNTIADFQHFKCFEEAKQDHFACLFAIFTILHKSKWEYGYLSSLIPQYFDTEIERKQTEKVKGAAGSFWQLPLQPSGHFAGELTVAVKAVAMRTTMTLVSE